MGKKQSLGNYSANNPFAPKPVEESTREASPFAEAPSPSSESPSSASPSTSVGVVGQSASADGQKAPAKDYGKRLDGTAKGPGWLGEIKLPSGDIATELSIGVEIDGKEIEIPSIVPTLNKDELDYLRNGGDPRDNESIVQKAISHAKTKISQGKSPFFNSVAPDGQRAPRTESDQWKEAERLAKAEQLVFGKKEIAPGYFDEEPVPIQKYNRSNPFAPTTAPTARVYKPAPQKEFDVLRAEEKAKSDAIYKAGAAIRDYERASAAMSALDEEYNKLQKDLDNVRDIPNEYRRIQGRIGAITEEKSKWNQHFKRTRSATDAFLDKIAGDFTSSVDMANGRYWTEKDGAILPNADEINSYVDKVLYDAGFIDIDGNKIERNASKLEGGGTTKMDPSLDVRHMITARLTSEAKNYKKYRKAIGAVEDVVRGRNQKVLDVAYDNVAILENTQNAIDFDKNLYSQKAKEEIDAYEKIGIVPQKNEIEDWYSRTVESIKAENDEINRLAESGQFKTQEEYNAALSAIQPKYDAAFAEYNKRNQQLIKEIDATVSDINFRWNSKFKSEAEAKQEKYKSDIAAIDQRLREAYGNNEELIAEAKRKFKETWKEESEKEAAAEEKVAYERYMKDAPVIRQIVRFSETYKQGIGGALKSYGVAFGNSDLYKYGNSLENSAIIPERSNQGIKDLFTVGWLERQGRLAGYMTPGIGATAAGSLIQFAPGMQGVGGTLISYGASGLLSWGSETAQMAGDIRMRVLDETGDITKANKAVDRMIDAQTAIIWSYGLEGAPYIKMPFGSSRLLPAIGLGFATEYSTELLFQEGPQQIAENRIMDEARGKIVLGDGISAAYDDFYAGVRDLMRSGVEKDPETGATVIDPATGKPKKKASEFEQLATDLVGIGFSGAFGGARDIVSERRAASDMLKTYLASDVVAQYATSGDSQWIDQMIERRGAEFSDQVFDGLKLSGIINQTQFDDLKKKAEVVIKARGAVRTLGLRGDAALAYKSFAAEAHDLRAKAELEQDEIIKNAFNSRAADIERSMASIASGKDVGYFVVNMPNKSKLFLSEDKGKEMMKDPNFLMSVAVMGMQREGGITIEAKGPGNDVALTELWKNVTELWKIADKDIGAVSNKYGVDIQVEDDATITVTPSKGAKISDEQTAKSILHRFGYTVNGYTPPANEARGSMTEEDVKEVIEQPAPAVEPSVTPAIAEREEVAITPDVPAPTMEWTGRQVKPKEDTLTPKVTYGRGDIVQEVEEPEVSKVIGMRGRFTSAGNIIPGTIAMHPEEQQTVVLIEDNGTMHDIGSIQDIRNRKIGDVGLELEDTAGQFRMSERGVVNVGGVNYIAPKGLDHIIRDEEGNIVEVRLPRVTSGGRVRGGEMSFTGGRAEELAYEITLRHIRDNANDAEIEAALAEARQAVQDEGVGRTAGPAPRTETKPTTGEVRQEEKPVTDAVQKRTTEEMGAQPLGAEGAREEGGEGVGPRVQGPEAPQAGGAEGEVTHTATGPVSPEAPATPAAAPAPAAPVTVAEPKAETVSVFQKLADLRDKLEATTHKGTKTRRQNEINKLLAENPQLAEADAKFAEAVKQLEDAKKLKVRCP